MIDDFEDTKVVAKSASQSNADVRTLKRSQEDIEAELEADKTLEEMFARKADTNDLMKFVFESVAQKKGYVILEDVLNWDFVQSLLSSSAASPTEIASIFSKCAEATAGRNKKSGLAKSVACLDKIGFELLVDQLSLFDPVSGNSRPDPVEYSESSGARRTATITVNKAVIPSPPTAASSLHPDLLNQEVASDELLDIGNLVAGAIRDFEDGMEGDEELYLDDGDSVEDAFSDLSNGGASVSLSSLLEWEPVAELLAAGVLSRETFGTMFQVAGGALRAADGKLDFEGFEKLLDLLAPYVEEELDEESLGQDLSMTNGALGVSSTQSVGSLSPFPVLDDAPVSRPSHSNIIPVPPLDGTTTLSRGGVKESIETNTIPSGKGASYTASDKDGEGEDDEEDDEALLLSVWENLANGKKKVSLKDLLGWDLVLELMGEGLLTESILEDKVIQSGGDKKGVDVAAFDKLIDLLVDMYKEVEGSDLDDEEEEVSVVKDKARKRLEANMHDPDVRDFVIEDGEDDDEEMEVLEGSSEDGEIFEIDTEIVFEEVSQGKNHVTLQDIRNWDLMKQMRDGGLMNDEGLFEVLRNSGIDVDKGDKLKIDIMAFEGFLDQLSLLSEDDELDEEEKEQ